MKKTLMPDSFDDFCNLGYVPPRRSGSKKGRGCHECIPPPAILKNVHEYNFSIISNLFDNNEPYAALSKHQSTMCEQNASYLKKHSELGAKKLNKIFLNTVGKAQTWPLLYENFQKFRGSMPLNPPKAFLVPRFTLN